MVTSALEQFRISDFLEWHENKQLVLNPEFQRQSVWPPTAKTYLIDTILRQLPVPKIYMRTKVDTATRRSYREVVDGQQRLRTIIDFGTDKFALGPRAKEFAGLRYSTLTPELQEAFLTYPIAVDQLINASDPDVLEVFARLNSYTVPVNAPELRHAKYQGEFKWAVHEASQRWSILWESLRIVSKRDTVRLLNDSLMAEMFGVLLDGVTDGGQQKITALYERYDEKFDRADVEPRLDEVVETVLAKLGTTLIASPLASGPHFLMLYAAVAHATGGIPQGELLEPLPPPQGLIGEPDLQDHVLRLSDMVGQDEPPKEGLALRFWQASKASTQRIASRRTRLPVYLDAVQDNNFRL